MKIQLIQQKKVILKVVLKRNLHEIVKVGKIIGPHNLDII